MRPPFAENYPDRPEIGALVERFDAGDYAAVRAGAARLASHEDAAVREAAKDLCARTSPDPAMKWLYLGVLALVLAIGAYWVVRTR